MHIPDGFLNGSTSISLIGVAAVAVSYAVKKVKKSFFIKQRVSSLKTPEGAEFGGGEVTSLTKTGQDKIFKMATVAAFIFAAQMINFPIGIGTSGHLLGGVLAAILLGPLEGLLAISVVLIVQSLFFADGGLVALGANIFNMAILGCLGGYFVYQKLNKFFKNKSLSAFASAWLSVILASLVCSVELALSGTVSLSSVLISMVSIHALIGLGEGLITVLVLKLMK